MSDNNVAVEEVVNQICSEGVQEVAKKVDFMQIGVTGAAIFGVVSFATLAGVGIKKFVIDKFFKKKDQEEGFEDDDMDDFDDKDLGDFTEVNTEEDTKEDKKKGKK